MYPPILGSSISISRKRERKKKKRDGVGKQCYTPTCIQLHGRALWWSSEILCLWPSLTWRGQGNTSIPLFSSRLKGLFPKLLDAGSKFSLVSQFCSIKILDFIEIKFNKSHKIKLKKDCGKTFVFYGIIFKNKSFIVSGQLLYLNTGISCSA